MLEDNNKRYSSEDFDDKREMESKYPCIKLYDYFLGRHQYCFEDYHSGLNYQEHMNHEQNSDKNR